MIQSAAPAYAALLLTAFVLSIAVILVLAARRPPLAPTDCVVGSATVGCTGILLRAMTFNLWGGGLAGGMPLQRSADVIAAARPDVVGLQEPGMTGGRNQLPELARLTGMALAEEANLLTVLPISDAWAVKETNAGGAQLRMPDGRDLFVYNVHLIAYPYGPHEIRDGKAHSQEEVEFVEEARLEEIERVLADVRQRVPADGCVLLLGDFNAPSHRDWSVPSERTYGRAVRWPVSLAVERDGFVDTFRALYPKASSSGPQHASARPGFTYSPIIRADDDHLPSDRIDMIFARGPALRLCDALVVGEPGEHSDIQVSPWPSDHRAVLAQVAWDS